MNESIQAIKAIVNPTNNTPIICDVKACFEPDVPSSTFANADAGISAALLPESWMNALRECFKERYQTTSKVLDLSSLHTDLTLLNRGYFIPLNKNIVFSSFLAILQENNARVGFSIKEFDILLLDLTPIVVITFGCTIQQNQNDAN